MAHVQADSYSVSPREWTEDDHVTGLSNEFTIKVVRRGVGRWAVINRLGQCLRHDGRRWAYESMPSSRTERFKRAYRMDLDAALRLAEKHVHKLTLYGKDFQHWEDHFR